MVWALIAVWSAPRTPLHALLSSPLRVPVVGLIVFGVFLVGASLNIGFRYALPALPLLAIVVAVAASTLWRRGRAWQWAVLVLPCWAALHALSYWPHHLAYLSEYGPDRSRNYEVVVDSSLDWGQGLVALQSFMTDQDIDCVALGYFGSARPGAYGIRYVPRESFLPLAVDDPARCSDPTWTVVSASLFQGAYLAGDPYRMLRNRPPDAVIAHTLLAWRD